jgi:hypothetical protein
MLTIYTLIEQKKGSLPTVGAFLDLEDAKKALLDRQEQLSTDYRRSEPVKDPALYSNYILENVRGSGEEILLRLDQTKLNEPTGRRLLSVELTDRESSLIHTFIRRSIFEQYERNMNEAGDTDEQTKTRAYETIEAFASIRDAIEEGSR